MITTLIVVLIACVIVRAILLSLVKTTAKVKSTWEKETKKNNKEVV